MSHLADLNRQFDEHLPRFVEEWKAFLRFPSVSSDPLHEADCLRCADWLAAHLRGMGFESRLLPAGGKPVVFAEKPGAPDKPRVLFYGHYDVQPPDPVELWTSPPFEPAFREGRLYARGAQDNKGQLFYVLKAIETLARDPRPGPTIRILIEGEEESSSPGISRSLPGWRHMLESDILMVCDTGASAPDVPTIIMGLRGIVTLTVSLSGPVRDLHSGIHGGIAPNPAQAMAHLLATLHRPDGGIAVKGFCDTALPPTAEERSLALSPPFDSVKYRAETGVDPVGGEQGIPAVERVGFRPTIEINGIHSGYGGDGSKTIIPATAFAKISARLVPGQDPRECLELLAAHLETHSPAGLKLDVSKKHAGGPALRMNLNSRAIAHARSVLQDLFGRAPAFLWEGASIPILTQLSEVSGGELVLSGQGLEADNIHAPNESFSIAQFRRGFLYAALFLSRL